MMLFCRNNAEQERLLRLRQALLRYNSHYCIHQSEKNGM
jgi:hypothetical protein